MTVSTVSFKLHAEKRCDSPRVSRGGDQVKHRLTDYDMKRKTRKLSYRKDDRAMRRMYGCPENFQESLTTPTATVPEIFNGLLFPLSL